MNNSPKLTSRPLWAWTAFDAGNSAHALLVSTVGFALYFQQVLFADSPRVDTLWALVTALVLTVAAVTTPFLTSWLAFRGRRAQGLVLVTMVCVTATAALGLPLERAYAIAVYIVSATGYYLALPIYNSYIEDVAEGEADRASARGWAVGYVGGIVAVALAFAFGLLSSPVTERPDLYRWMFVLAAVFNLICSAPLMVWAMRAQHQVVVSSLSWTFSRVFDVLRTQPRVLRLLFSYWMVSECGTIAIYFTAIFLARYVGMPVATIFALTLAIQLLGAASTWSVGELVRRIGASPIYTVVCVIWATVPFLLWIISVGWSYWFALVGLGLVIGAHHAIVRGEVAKIAAREGLEADAKGSIFGFLEVTGRITSILGPLIVGLFTFFVPLSQALLVASVFPVIALLAIRGYKWRPAQS